MENILQQLFSENIAQALCRTLLHSLWQGLILAVVTGLIVLFTRKSSAVKRYYWLVGALCFFAISFVFTLVVSLNSSPHIVPIIKNAGTGSPDIWELLNYNLLYVQEHADMVVMAWLILACAKSFKMLLGLYSLERIRRTKVNMLNPEWEQKMNVLARAMGIKQAVSILESAIIKVPVIIGHLKPLILVPIGLINSLNTQDVEAILLHELAHIRRRDYLVNLLQNFLETIFFFNPAVIWLSALIRTEREHCCDEMVVSQTKNKIRYISALIHFEEYRLSAPAYALAFTGKRGGMLQRMERMATNRNRSLSKLEIVGLAFLLLLSGLFIAAKRSPELIPIAKKPAPTRFSPEFIRKKRLREREVAARVQFLEQKEAQGTANKSEALELLRYQHKEPPAATQSQDKLISAELRKYYQQRELETARRLRAEEAVRQRTQPKDSIP